MDSEKILILKRLGGSRVGPGGGGVKANKTATEMFRAVLLAKLNL